MFRIIDIAGLGFDLSGCIMLVVYMFNAPRRMTPAWNRFWYVSISFAVLGIFLVITAVLIGSK